MIGYWHDSVVRLSVTLCIVDKWYNLQQVSEHVNRKRPPKNTILQLSTPYTDPISSNSLPQKFIHEQYEFLIYCSWIWSIGVVIVEYCPTFNFVNTLGPETIQKNDVGPITWYRLQSEAKRRHQVTSVTVTAEAWNVMRTGSCTAWYSHSVPQCECWPAYDDTWYDAPCRTTSPAVLASTRPHIW